MSRSLRHPSNDEPLRLKLALFGFVFRPPKLRSFFIILFLQSVYVISGIWQIGFVLHFLLATEATEKGGFLSDLVLRASDFRPSAGDWVCFFAPKSGIYLHNPFLTRNLRSFGHLVNWLCFAFLVSHRDHRERRDRRICLGFRASGHSPANWVCFFAPEVGGYLRNPFFARRLR